MRMKAKIYLWTGNGWGKTTSALGATIRALGHGYKVSVIQFMKGWGSRVGEVKIAKKLGPKFQLKQFGSKKWIHLKKPSFKDKENAKKGLLAAYSEAKKKPFLLVLDEINLAVRIGLLKEKEVLAFLDNINPKTTVYLTGRKATPGLLKRADYVNEILCKKKPKPSIAKKGIDY
ncbi:cob(I)yrinic acid a,c-diamide adenosyltransferase [Candidatus Woesearchaeota archaeon]|nr:cob(I)yrinic acid a,c-diamide adenosyltransferase [Candidatus Woesearchaeota archaeon]